MFHSDYRQEPVTASTWDMGIDKQQIDLKCLFVYQLIKRLSVSPGGQDRDQCLQNPVVCLWRAADPWCIPLNSVVEQWPLTPGKLLATYAFVRYFYVFYVLFLIFISILVCNFLNNLDLYITEFLISINCFLYSLFVNRFGKK